MQLCGHYTKDVNFEVININALIVCVILILVCDRLSVHMNTTII